MNQLLKVKTVNPINRISVSIVEKDIVVPVIFIKLSANTTEKRRECWKPQETTADESSQRFRN